MYTQEYYLNICFHKKIVWTPQQVPEKSTVTSINDSKTQKSINS